MSTFRDKLLLGSLLTLLILTISASYYRFVVSLDFLVTYEIDCDPETENCFIGCEDEECTAEYYFSEIERGAQWLETMCGADITNCEIMNSCTDTEEYCIVTRCDAVDTPDDCSEFTT